MLITQGNSSVCRLCHSKRKTNILGAVAISLLFALSEMAGSIFITFPTIKKVLLQRC
jgi:hypothetical protein